MSAQEDAKPSGLRILLVEDEADTAATTAYLLQHFGHEVEVAADGLAALAKARANWPDVVLLDIVLPGMDGYELARQLQAEGGRKPPLIIAVTGYAGEEFYRRSREVGITFFYLKPVAIEDLQRLLGTLKR
jgi:CheY-like chemotaxis protein